MGSVLQSRNGWKYSVGSNASSRGRLLVGATLSLPGAIGVCLAMLRTGNFLPKFIAAWISLSLLLPFLAVSARANDEATRDLLAAADRGDVAAAKSAVSAGARIDDASVGFAGADQQPPIVAASLRGHAMLVRLLLDWGADPLATEKDGYNVWHAAAFQGHVEVLRVLIDRNVDGYGLHEDGMSPLHRACWGRLPRHSQSVETLIETGGRDCNEAAADGRTPLKITRNPRTAAILRNCISKQDAARMQKDTSQTMH